MSDGKNNKSTPQGRRKFLKGSAAAGVATAGVISGRLMRSNIASARSYDGALPPGSGLSVSPEMLLRIEEDGTSCAYVTDNELEPPGSVETSSGSIHTLVGDQNAPTRFLPSGRLTPVLPPTELSTWETIVVGI